MVKLTLNQLTPAEPLLFLSLCVHTGICIRLTNKTKQKEQHNKHPFVNLKVSLGLDLVAVHT